MEYAIVVYFNESIEKKLNSLILEVAEKSGNNYMIEHSIPPHITLSLFHKENDDKEQILSIFDRNDLGLKNGTVFLASIGIFNPSVLFIAPIVNDYLIEIHSRVNSLLKNIIDIQFDKNYLHNQWVPHISIAVKLNDIELIKAFEASKNKFTVMEVEIDRIALAECNPYNEIKIRAF